MNTKKAMLAVFISLSLFLTACKDTFRQTESTAATDASFPAPMQTEASAATLSEEPSVDEEVHTETTLAPETESAHSPLYIDGLDVSQMIRYFNEVCLDAEIENSGDASVLQKWIEPIHYTINGSPTEEDLAVLNAFTAWLNTIEGFPGIYETQNLQEANLEIHFCTQQDLLMLMGDSFTDLDGAVTFWYEDDVIYNATICCRTDLSQSLRNSVILEELYNGLGPIQDTSLRPDSIIYNDYSEPQSLTAVDELILKLLYHPQLMCGMGAEECEEVIRRLYY